MLRAARDVHEAARLPGLNTHPLKGNRDGQWAIILTGFHRLIFRVLDDAGEVIEFEEVSKHYDD